MAARKGQTTTVLQFILIYIRMVKRLLTFIQASVLATDC